MKDTVTISLTDLLNGTLEMGDDDYKPNYIIPCDECGDLIREIDGDDVNRVICNKCFFSFEENGG